jgi:hypothetical protein
VTFRSGLSSHMHQFSPTRLIVPEKRFSKLAVDLSAQEYIVQVRIDVGVVAEFDQDVERLRNSAPP